MCAFQPTFFALDVCVTIQEKTNRPVFTHLLNHLKVLDDRSGLVSLPEGHAVDSNTPAGVGAGIQLTRGGHSRRMLPKARLETKTAVLLLVQQVCAWARAVQCCGVCVRRVDESCVAGPWCWLAAHFLVAGTGGWTSARRAFVGVCACRIVHTVGATSRRTAARASDRSPGTVRLVLRPSYRVSRGTTAACWLLAVHHHVAHC